MSWLINRARSALDLDQDQNLMAVIHVIASDLSRHGELYQSESVFAALDALSGNAADTPRVRAVVATETQIDPDTAAELWQGLRDKLNERIPERFRALTLTVEQLQQSTAGASGSSVLWPIIDGGSASRDVDLCKPVLALTGSASGTIAIEVLNSASLSQELQPDDAQPLVRMGLEGRLQANAGLSLPLRSGRGGLGAGGSGTMELNYYFRNNPHLLLARAAARNFQRLRSPFDLAQLIPLMGQPAPAPVQAEPRLQLLTLAAKGEIGFSGKFNLASSALPPAGIPGADVNLEIGFIAKRTGDFLYSLRSADNGTDLLLDIKRGRSEAQTVSALAGVVLDISGLPGRLKEIATEPLGEAKELLDQLDSVLITPDNIRKKLGKQVEKSLQEPRYHALIQATLGVDGEKSAEERLADLIAGAIDTHTEKWSGRADTVARDLVDRMLDRTGLFDLLPEDKRSDLESAVEDALKGLHDRLEKQLKELVKSNSGFRKLAQILNGIEPRVDESIEGLANRLQAVTGPVLRELNRYQGFLQQLTEILEKAARARLAINFSSKIAEERGRSLDLRLLIRARHEGAQQALEQLLTGSLEGVFETLRTVGTDGAVIPLAGALKRYSAYEKKNGFELILMDFRMTASSLLRSEVQFEEEINGNIRIASRGEIVRQRNNWKEGRAIRFVNAFELAAARRTRSLGISLTVSHEDTDLDLDDVRPLFVDLESEGLLAAGSARRAVDLLADIEEQNPDSAQKGKLDLQLALDYGGVLRMLSIADPAAGETGNPLDEARVRRIAAQQIVHAAQKISSWKPVVYKLDKQSIERVQQLAGQIGLSGTLVEIVLGFDSPMKSSAEGAVERAAEDGRYRFGQQDVYLLDTLHNEVEGIATLIHTMRGIFFSADGPRPWTRDEYHQAQRRLDQALAFWLKPGGKWIFLINDEIRPYVVAFMRILTQLAGIPPASGQRPHSLLCARMSLDTGTGNKSYPLTGPVQ